MSIRATGRQVAAPSSRRQADDDRPVARIPPTFWPCTGCDGALRPMTVESARRLPWGAVRRERRCMRCGERLVTVERRVEV